VWFSSVLYSKDELFPPAFNKEERFIDHKVGDIVPMMKVDSGEYDYAFFEIKSSSYRAADWLYDCDGYKYDLEFHHIGSIFSGTHDYDYVKLAEEEKEYHTE